MNLLKYVSFFMVLVCLISCEDSTLQQHQGVDVNKVEPGYSTLPLELAYREDHRLSDKNENEVEGNEQYYHPFLSQEEFKLYKNKTPAERSAYELKLIDQESFIHMGYGKEAAKKMAFGGDMKQTVSIDEHEDPKNKAEMRALLEQQKRDGFTYELESIVRDYYEADINILDYSHDYKGLTFEPRLKSDIVNNKYTYKGYTFTKEDRDASLPGGNYVLNVYENNKVKLIISESDMDGAKLFNTTEFVTHRIDGYPSTIEKLRSKETSKEVYRMTVANEERAYVACLIDYDGSDKQAIDELYEIGKEIFK